MYSYQKVVPRMKGDVNDDAMKGSFTIEQILLDGKGKVTLIEGDPGCGKTTLTLHMCKRWAEGDLLRDNFLILVPLRCYELATNADDLFKFFDNLGCPLPAMREHAQQNNGEGLLLILDGWDELPSQLQIASLFSDIIFSKNSMFLYSTIIVTSRPSCSENVAKLVQQRKAYYKILGFNSINFELFIKHYFKDDLHSAELLLGTFISQEHIYQHFYIPITVAIMCFVYSHSDEGHIPETISKLYEDFVLLYICSNVPNTYRKDFKKFYTLSNVPKIIKPLFNKLCKAAYKLLKDNKLVFDEDTLGITDDNLNSLGLDPEQFDGLGLLHVQYLPTKWATTKRSYSFIHRAVQELLAAIFIVDTGIISDVLDEYFYEGSYFINVFPFAFGLMSKELLIPLGEKLIQIYKNSNENEELFFTILYCLFEAHEERLCREFGQIFSESPNIYVLLPTLLDCYYASYFISFCGAKRLNVFMDCTSIIASGDLYCEIAAKYLQSTSTDIASFYFKVCCFQRLSLKGIKQLAEVLSNQRNIVTVHINTSCDLGCISILCDSILKYNPQTTCLRLPVGDLNENDVESIWSLLKCLSLENLHMNCSPSEGVCLDLLLSVSKALSVCATKSLQKLVLTNWGLSQTDCEVFGIVISQNCSLKELCIQVATADCLDPILKGLSCNTSIATFVACPSKTGACSTLGQHLEKCFTVSHSLNTVDFSTISHFFQVRYIPWLYISWSSMQVVSICTGLCNNTTVVTLDISGCYIDTEASHAVCRMLSQNTTLQHLFLNPIHLEKQEAIAIINSCTANSTLKLLSLMRWPPDTSLFSFVFEEPVYGEKPFKYFWDEDVCSILKQVEKQREEKGVPHLNICWLVY